MSEQDIFNNECLIVTGLISAACERTVVPASKGYGKLTNGIHPPMLKAAAAHNGNNGFKSSNSSLNGVYTSTTTNGVC